MDDGDGGVDSPRSSASMVATVVHCEGHPQMDTTTDKDTNLQLWSARCTAVYTCTLEYTY